MKPLTSFTSNEFTVAIEMEKKTFFDLNKTNKKMLYNRQVKKKLNIYFRKRLFLLLLVYTTSVQKLSVNIKKETN